MVRVCRVDASLRSYFTANELSGWPDGVSYSVTEKRRKKRKIKVEAERPTAVPISIGRTAPAVSIR